MTVAAAQKTLADLRAKLAETETRVLLLEGERSSISYAALAERDPKAVKRLQELNAELLAVEADACAVEAAIREGERRVAAATQAEQAVAEQAKATEALKLKEQMLAAATKADAGMQQAFAALTQIFECSSALNRLGSGPNSQVVEANLKRVLVAASLASRFPLGALAPVDRHTAVELVERWAEAVDAFVAEREPKIEQKVEPKIEEAA